MKRSSGEADDWGDRSTARGRTARTPSEVPRKGWGDILKRTYQQIAEDNLSIVAAGVAFYAFVSAVPALAATVAIYGLLADPASVSRHLETLAEVMPRDVMPMLSDQVKRIVENENAAGWGAILGIGLALYTAARATQATMRGLNIVYDETETRGFIKFYAVSLILTIAAVVGVLIMIALIAVLPAVLGAIGLSQTAELLLNLVRWPILLLFFMVGLAVLYRYGSSRNSPQWRWVSPGTVIASILWILGSIGFSIYVSNFGSYNEVYGSLGAIVVALMWLYLSAFVVLLGAEFNSEAERQTKVDTTEGRPHPMGQREAYAADTVGDTGEQTKRQQEREKRERERAERRQKARKQE